MNKKVTAIGLSAGLLAGLGAGFLLEMSGDAGASQRTTLAVAANTGDTTTPDADRTARLQEILQPLVDDGTLTQAQADKVIAALSAEPVMGRGDGDGGPGGRGAGMFGGLDSVATLLGITTDELATELQSGSTLAEVAVAHGKTAQDVIDVLVQAVKDHFTPEVASGEHTQAEADAMIAAATQQITDVVNNGGGFGGRGPGGRDGDGDHGGPSDGDVTPTSADA